MGVASVVHLYVFPAKPYELMGERYTGAVAVLGDYVSADLPVDPEEVRDSERPTKLRLPQPDVDTKGGMTIRESVKDVFIGGREYVSLFLFAKRFELSYILCISIQLYQNLTTLFYKVETTEVSSGCLYS